MATLTLAQMVLDMKAELRQSLNAAHGLNVEDTYKYLLRSTQRELYAMDDWPFYITDEYVNYNAGDRYIGPFTDVDYEQINGIWTLYGTTQWRELSYGIHPSDYTVYDSNSDKRTDPIAKYRPWPKDETIEIWPIPVSDGQLLVRGQLMLKDLVDDADVSTLDGTMIVLFAAAEQSAHQKDENAALKLQKAQAHKVALLKNFGSQKRRPFSTVPKPQNRDGMRPGIDFMPRRK